ncbi:MAG: hypothetical protein ACREOZ_04310, partial [Gloeomargaritales cyanobacterium]
RNVVEQNEPIHFKKFRRHIHNSPTVLNFVSRYCFDSSTNLAIISEHRTIPCRLGGRIWKK